MQGSSASRLIKKDKNEDPAFNQYRQSNDSSDGSLRIADTGRAEILDPFVYADDSDSTEALRMSETRFAEQLISNMRRAMRRPERESLVGYLTFWAVSVACVAIPVALAVLIHITIAQPLLVEDSNVLTDDPSRGNAVLLSDNSATDPATALDATTLAYIPSWKGELASIHVAEPPISDEADKDRIALHEGYQAAARFLSAMALFCLGALAVLHAQARTFIRYWLRANHDRPPAADSTTTRTIRHNIRVLILLVVAVLVVGSGATSTAAICLVLIPVAIATGQLLFPERFVTKVASPLTVRVDAEQTLADLSNMPVLMLPPTLATGLFLGSLGFQALSEQHGSFSILSAWIEPLFLSSVALCFSVAVYSIMLIISVARDFPSQRQAMDVACGSFDNPLQAEPIAADAWHCMARHVRKIIGDATASEIEAARAGLPYPALTPAQARKRFPPNPTFSTATARNGTTLINTVCLPFALLMATSLVVLSLGLDLHTLPNKDSEALIKARDDSETALILLLGTSMVIMYSLVVGHALTRLDVFVREDRTAPENGERKMANAPTISSLSRYLDGYKLMTDQHPSADALHQTILRRHIGASQEKFGTILGASHYFAAFQYLLGQGWIERISMILTALAPVALPTLVGILT